MRQIAESIDIGPVDGEESGLWAIQRPADHHVFLADGSACALDGLAGMNCWPCNGGRSANLPGKSWRRRRVPRSRPRVTRQAYDLATHILARVQGSMDRPLDMGMVPRHGTLVLDLLRRQRQRGQSARFFGMGYGAGTLLKTVAEAGFPIAGIEVASAMRRQAVAQLGPEYEDCLHLGEFLKCKAPLADGPWSLVYWNDVFEHIPPDEIGDWLQRIHAMLAPGGQLVTVTPNWHCRPADVTAAICPPRSEAAGLHLKEYTLVEVSRLLRRAGSRAWRLRFSSCRGGSSCAATA